MCVIIILVTVDPSKSARRPSGRDHPKQPSGNVWTELQRRLARPPDPWLQSSLSAAEACIDTADVRANTIIRTNASRAAGARFIDSSSVGSSHDCVAKCCDVSNCNLAVVDSKFDQAKCFLFDCKHPTVCQFTAFDGYSSISLPRGSASASPFPSHIRRVNIPSPRGPPSLTSTAAPTATTTTTLTTTTSTSSMGIQEADLDSWRLLVPDDSKSTAENRNGPPTVSPSMLGDVIKLLQRSKMKSEPSTSAMPVVITTSTTTSSPISSTSFLPHQGSCQSAYEVHCADLDGCVALNDVCDGYAQCVDASDENADVCQAVRGSPDYAGGKRGGDAAGGDGDRGSVGVLEKSEKRINDKTVSGVHSVDNQGNSSPNSQRRQGKLSNAPVFAATSSSSSSPSRLRDSRPTKINPRLMGDKNEMTRQLDAMMMTTTMASPARSLATLPADQDANVNRISVLLHRPYLGGIPTTPVMTSITTSWGSVI